MDEEQKQWLQIVTANAEGREVWIDLEQLVAWKWDTRDPHAALTLYLKTAQVVEISADLNVGNAVLTLREACGPMVAKTKIVAQAAG